MSLRKYILNRESEEVMEEVVPTEVEAEEGGIVEEIEAAEAVEEHNEAVEELAETQELVEEADELKEEIEEKIEELQEVIAEAETKAEETGEAPEVPVEEIVAAQEALKYFIKTSGYRGEVTMVSREDITSNPYEALKVTQEGLKEVKDFVVRTADELAGKVKEVSKKVLFTLKTLLPTKRNIVLKLQNELKKASAITADVAALETEFVNTNKTTLGAIVALFGDDLEGLAAGLENYVKAMGAVKLKVKAGNFVAGLENLDMTKIFPAIAKFPEVEKFGKKGYKNMSVIGATVADNNITLNVVLYDSLDKLETDVIVITRDLTAIKFDVEKAIKVCDNFLTKYGKFDKALVEIDSLIYDITGLVNTNNPAMEGNTENAIKLNLLYDLVIEFGQNIDSVAVSTVEFVTKYGSAVIAASKAAPASEEPQA